MEKNETARVMEQWRNWIKAVEADQVTEIPKGMEYNESVLLQKSEVGYAA
jgi:hypothetical protein